MNTKHWTVVVTLTAMLCSPLALASAETTETATASAAQAVPKRASSGHGKTSLKKSRRYSPATLSAFQPYVPSSTAESTPSFINTAPAADLRASPSQLEPAAKSSVFNVESSRGAVLVDDDDHSAFEQAAASATGDPASFEANALGGDSVSVIDRIADKPKAKAIASGPLRVRVNDRALRASVQIPISDR